MHDVTDLLPPHPRQRLLVLAANYLGSAAVGLAVGGLIPLIALMLARRGVEPVLIGANAAMASLGIVAMAVLVPWLLDRMAVVPAMVAGVGLSVLSLLTMPILPGLGAWFALRFLMGAGIAIFWVVSETWMNAIASRENRGLIMAGYAAALSAGFAVGPLLLPLVGSEGWLPFLVFAGALAAGAAPVLLVRRLAPRLRHRGFGNPMLLWRAAPTVLAASAASGLYEAGLLSFLPLYGLRAGMAETASILLLSVFLAGNVLLQVPLGWLADRVNRRALLLACAIVSILGPMLTPLLLGFPVVLAIVLVIWGGFAFGIYTIGLALLGDRFAPGDLAAANAAFVQVYVLANVVGSPLAGAAMDGWDPHGLMLFMGLVALGFAIVAGWRGLRRPV